MKKLHKHLLSGANTNVLYWSSTPSLSYSNKPLIWLWTTVRRYLTSLLSLSHSYIRYSRYRNRYFIFVRCVQDFASPYIWSCVCKRERERDIDCASASTRMISLFLEQPDNTFIFMCQILLECPWSIQCCAWGENSSTFADYWTTYLARLFLHHVGEQPSLRGNGKQPHLSWHSLEK